MINEEYIKQLGFNDYQKKRTLLMYDIACEISKEDKNSLILKGGTSLLFCYNLNRFSTDLDYDGMTYNFNLDKIFKNCFLKNNLHWDGNIKPKKHTQTVIRYMLHYKESEDDPLKIEISFRNMDYIENGYNYFEIKNGIKTYPIPILARSKIDTFLDRMKARDIFDAAFLLKTYPGAIDDERIIKCNEKIKSLGLDYFEKELKNEPVLSKFDHEDILLNFENAIKSRVINIDKKKQ